MDKETKSGYVAGFISIIISAFFIIISIDLGWNLTGQLLAVFGLTFSFLGIGSFLKPRVIGPVAYQILENMARSVGKEDKRVYKQNQNKSRNSPQGYTEKGNIIIKQNFYRSGSSRKKKYR